MNARTRRYQALQRELLVSSNIPYECHLTPSIVLTDQGDYLCVLRLAGAAFECADDEVLNNRHERLNKVLLSLADPRITIWQHIVRREEKTYPDGAFPDGFARDLNAKYAAQMRSATLMVNELYLSIVLRPHTSWSGKTLAKLLVSADQATIAAQRQEQVALLDEIVAELEASLGYYEAQRLRVYRRDGVLFSAPAEFFGYLVNGSWEPIALAPGPLKNLLASSRPFFGSETIEIRGATQTQFGAMLGIKGYPHSTSPIYLDDLLTVPCKIVVTQSFSFQQQDAALRKLGRAANVMLNAGDAARSQIEEIPDMADALVSRRVAMGSHHYTVLVQGETLRALARNIAQVRAILSHAGIMSAREDLANEAAYWAQLPGVFSKRPRLSMINSRNASGFMPLHNFPTGRRTGNHWGDALAMLVTAAGTPHYLSLHAADPLAANGGAKKDVAHTLLAGPNGCGKTAVAMFLLCMLQKFGITAILFSKDRDTEITIRALGGKFYPIQIGEPTGWNPFALDPAEAGTLPYLRQLVRKLVSRPRRLDSGIEVDDAPLSVAEEQLLDGAVTSALALAWEFRHLGRVLDFLPEGEGSVHARLSKWCHARKPGQADGVHAWVFDNLADTLAATLGSGMTTGFDVTQFLDDPELLGPINLHLFYLAARLMDGRRIAIFISEFWKALGDPGFSAFCKDLLKTLRKKNGFVVLDTQSPSDALAHPISRTLIEQVATFMLFPNPGADQQEYMQGLNLSEREYALVKTDMPEGAGMFLLKQGRHSVVVKLPLAGLDDELAVLSARTSNIALLEQLIAEYGEAPASWLPWFYAQRSAS